MHFFLLAVPNPDTWFAGFWRKKKKTNSFFGPAVCLAITVPLSKKVNKRQKIKNLHWLVSLMKHRGVVWLGGAGCHVCQCL